MKIPYDDAIEICEALVHIVNEEGCGYFRKEAISKAEHYIELENQRRSTKGMKLIDPNLIDPNL